MDRFEEDGKRESAVGNACRKSCQNDCFDIRGPEKLFISGEVGYKRHKGVILVKELSAIMGPRDKNGHELTRASQEPYP